MTTKHVSQFLGVKVPTSLNGKLGLLEQRVDILEEKWWPEYQVLLASTSPTIQ